MDKRVDLVVIGAGPAGMTAALGAKQAGYHVVLYEKSMPGGKLNTYQTFENFPGYEHIPPQSFGLKLYEELTKIGVESTYGDVTKIVKTKDGFLIHSDTENIETKSVIVATGTREKPLMIPGADRWFGQGVSYCAACDGIFFKNKDVVVIGHQRYALEEAVYLANLCHHVYVLMPTKDGTSGQNQLVKLKQLVNVTVIEEATPIELIGDSIVTGIRYQTLTHGEQALMVDGVFPMLGWMPNSESMDAFKHILDPQRYVIADEKGVTAIPGLFVIGDLQAKTTRKVKNVIAQGQLVIQQLKVFFGVRK
jgi:thioredoxin reductase (NADPH)